MAGRNDAPRAQHRSGIADTVVTILYALLFAGLVRSFVFQPFWIPSGSMKDTLLVGDLIYVNKFAYGYSRFSCPWGLCPIPGRIFASMPRRGDVVVFRHPVSGADYIKRLIGLPGDRIQMKDGRLWLNGVQMPVAEAGTFSETMAPQGPLAAMPRCANFPAAPGDACLKARETETLPGGVTHDILNIGTTESDNTQVFTVPPGEFFFMGDNRDNSEDSRFSQSEGGVGFVPFAYLEGRADRILLSSAGTWLISFWDWRPDRFLKAIR